ncbi:MFS transporter [Legionella sp. W05-934-2]|jgi:MHS family proline/betaine transporter-like MFS transporter|uniref:MFS transporter n=1 Tax=Legionella sp. W05-934-2 TaxID=1198649 RepID=UPI0034630E8C
MNNKQLSLSRIVIPGLLGNVLEWYDFALYGYYAATISPLFFPAQNKTVSLIAAFVVFAIGYIMRPLGAIVFGHLGDRIGRKNALSMAILLMAIPTTIIGLLPEYDTIGIWATWGLIACRLLQGLAVGGEFTGAMVYILEHAQNKHQGFYSALAMSSAFLGLLLGSLACSITSLFSISWLWRVPFVFSLLLGFLGLYLRLRMPETPAFTQLIQTHTTKHAPVKTLFKHHWRDVIRGVGFVMLPTASFYMCFLYLPTYLHHFYQIPHALVQWSNNAGLIALILLTPVFGLLVDRFGKVNLQVLGLACFISLSLPLFIALTNHSTWSILCVSLVFSLMVAIVFAGIPALLYDLFPAPIRYSGLSFPYNLATALFGGSTPAINTALINHWGDMYIPAYYLIALSVFSLLFFIKPPLKKALIESKVEIKS